MMTPYFQDESVTLWHGDALTVLRELPAESVDCCVTSPPYFGLRDYGTEGQYGLEASPAEYVEMMRAVFAEVRRVLAADGTLWLNIGDTYYSGKGAAVGPDKKQPARRGFVRPTDKSGAAWARPKSLLGIPWRLAFALQDDGWTLRNDIIWSKPNAMPESVTDRLSCRHEHLFMLSKSRTYWFDLDPIREPILWPEKTGHTFGGNSPDVGRRRGAKYEPDNRGTYRAADGSQHLGGHDRGRNPGDVWTIATSPFAEAHFAVMPPAVAERCIAAGCKPLRGCDCEQEIATPVGGRLSDDPTLTAGRRGLGRERHNTPPRIVTKREQRHHAAELRASPFRSDIERLAGDAFAHYIRTDASGARPLPPELRADLLGRGWITPAPPCGHVPGEPGTVLDPFSGSGTTGLAAAKHGRKYVGIDLNADYLDLSLRTRLAQTSLLDGGAA